MVHALKYGAIFQALIASIVKQNLSYMIVNADTTLLCWKFVVYVYRYIGSWASDLQVGSYAFMVVYACNKYWKLGTLEKNAGKHSFSIYNTF